MSDRFEKLRELARRDGRTTVLRKDDLRALLEERDGLDDECKKSMQEIANLRADVDELLEALRQIDKIVYGHQRGAAGKCQMVAREAIARTEGRQGGE